MIQWIYIDLIVLLCVMSLTGIIIPQILLIAFRKNLFDTPDPRKIHKAEIPRLGGIAFFPAIMFAVILLYGFGLLYGHELMAESLAENSISICFVIAGAILLYLVGMADDLIGVRYSAKFVMQAISACLIVIGGLTFSNFHGFLGLYQMPLVPAVLMTILLIVFITNAVNLIDGIDGLASGLSAIACLFYAFVFIDAGLYIYSALAVATLGTLVPFYIYNVFGNAQKRKKIFMGDTGALTIGLFLSVMAIRITQIPDDASGYNSAVMAFAPLLIPCLDVVRVYLHRIKARRNPFLPDKCHIHHKLLALGMKQRVAMMTIIGTSAIVILLNYVACRYISITSLFFADLILWIVANTILTRSIHVRERRLSRALYE